MLNINFGSSFAQRLYGKTANKNNLLKVDKFLDKFVDK